MYCNLESFLNDWEKESDLTIKMFESLTDESLNQAPYENVRTLARLAWHITHTITEMPHKAGLFDEEFAGEDDLPATVSDLVAKFKEFSAKLIHSLKTKWADASLDEKLTIYGQSWTKGQLLEVLTKHMIHHRGQMTVIMRLLGLKVPGIYGPAKEEWKMFGMDTKE
ncbi:MAG: hypothetical protein SCALA702_24560 [Melioribacteraceae bacterium]|nr:MAG: hypothetical protein SCALA702_24560 [Melioribacteraceae bacterium]